MILVSYDISSNKTRTRFSKFLTKYGRRIQYSLFEIQNSKRVLQIILKSVENRYKKQFELTDSILIFQITEADEKRIIRYGYAVNEEEKLLVF